MRMPASPRRLQDGRAVGCDDALVVDGEGDGHVISYGIGSPIRSSHSKSHRRQRLHSSCTDVLVQQHLHLVETAGALVPRLGREHDRLRPPRVGVVVQVEELRDVVALGLDVHLGQLAGGQVGVHRLRHQVAVAHRLHDGARPAHRVAGREDARHVDLERLADVEGRLAVHPQALIFHPGDLADGGDQQVARHVELGAGHGDRLAPAAAVVVAQALALQPDAGHAIVAQDRGRVHQEVELHALFERALDLLMGGRHVAALAAVDHVHLGRAQAPRRPGRVHRGVAAAHHHDPLALQIGRITAGDVAQHLHRVIDPPLVLALDAEIAAAVRAQRQHDRRVPLVLQALDGEVAAQLHVLPERHARAPDVLDLGEERLPRQAVGRDAVGHHAAGPRHPLEHGDVVAALRQPQRGRQPARARADNRHLDVLLRRHLGRQPRHVEQPVGHETLGLADGDRLVDVPAAAALLAERRAHAAADQRKGVGVAVDVQRLRIAALGDQRQVRGHVHAGRARADAAGAHQHLAARGRAARLLDVRQELLLEVAQRGEHGRRGQLAQRAQRTFLHPVRDLADAIQVRQLAVARGDALQDLQHAGAADAARRAFAAAFVADELHEVLRELDHAGGLVRHDHAARPHHRARGAERVEVHRRVEIRLGQAAAQRAAGLHGLELSAVRDAAADLVDDLAQGEAHRHFDQPGAR